MGFRLAALCLWIFVFSAEAKTQSAIFDRAAIKRARIYEPIIKDAASRHEIDARMLWVIAYLESRFNPALVSRKGARGIMQLMPMTAARFGLNDPHDPVGAIDAAARYIRILANRFANRADLVLAAYNSGEVTVEAYLKGCSIRIGNKIINPNGIITGGIPPYRETVGYVERGMRLLSSLPQAKRLISRSAVQLGKERSHNSLVRKSVRTSGKQGQSEVEQERAAQMICRRSIYFGMPGEQN